jgi:hypothetical protein
VNSSKPIKAMDYLRSLDTEVIFRAYPAQLFNAETDKAAAMELMTHARLSGVAVVIPPASLGRHRSTIGLVAHRSPRGKAEVHPALPEAATGEPEALQLDLPAATLEERKVAALESATRAFWAMRDVLAKQASFLQVIAQHYRPFIEDDGPGHENQEPQQAWPRE